MLQKRLNGPGASSRKYDLLTALGSYALGADRSTQRRILRLITLITARYNWGVDELTVGRREIARLWCVDERTVKRELAALKSLGVVRVKRPSARGRVTCYALDFAAILHLSAEGWGRVGRDYELRMTEMVGQGAPTVDANGSASIGYSTRTIIPFPAREDDTPEEPPLWREARRQLASSDAARDAAWFAPLVFSGVRSSILQLEAPSEFHLTYVETNFLDILTRTIRFIDPSIERVRLKLRCSS